MPNATFVEIIVFFMKKAHHIPFNKPYFSGQEAHNMTVGAASGKISGNGMFTQKCHKFFEDNGFDKVLLTTSCTDALEMSALLCRIEPGDEVIMPSYTFVSTATAFVLRGANIIFADSQPDHPNIDPDHIEELITPKTKALVVVHYAGVACDMDRIMKLSQKHGFKVIEDAAHAYDSFYKGKPLGSIGDFGTFSFHETKNIISGEGGLLSINNASCRARAEILWEKGTNRAAFARGEVAKYEWVDLGSSFLPPEMVGAFLYAQLEASGKIQKMRISIEERYHSNLDPLAEKGLFHIPKLPDYASRNGNMFYLVCHSKKERDALIQYLRKKNVHAVFHYLPLHESPYYKDKYHGRKLINAERYSDCIIRFPFYNELSINDIDLVCDLVQKFY